MNRTIQTVAAAMLVAGAAATPALLQEVQSKPKFAYINSRIIVEQTPDRALIAQQFEKEMEPIKARLQQLADSDAAIRRKYQEEQAGLTPAVRAAREKEITDKLRTWQLQADSLNSFANARGQELERPMTELLKKIIADIRQEEGYWMILDVAGEGGLNIVAIDRNLEITDRVLAKYKTAAAALPKPAPLKIPPGGGPVNGTTGVGRIIPPPKS
jgi:Skp family chaperone for outer membrane proteins